jgi:hypothetical protein
MHAFASIRQRGGLEYRPGSCWECRILAGVSVFMSIELTDGQIIIEKHFPGTQINRCTDEVCR